jgi:hypothetical protein
MEAVAGWCSGAVDCPRKRTSSTGSAGMKKPSWAWRPAGPGQRE